MDHVVESRDLLIGIRDDGIVHRGVLRLIDIVDPTLMGIQGIDADRDDFYAALLELGRNLGHGPQLGGTNRGIVLRM